MYHDIIDNVKNELNARSIGYVRRVEELLEQIASLDDPTYIADLLSLLDDSADHDQIMFSIVHIIERFDDAIFVSAIVQALGALLSNAPRWAVILHVRILNSDKAMAAYVECVKSLSPEKRAAVRNVLEAVRKRNAKFESRCDSLLVVLQA